MKSHTKKHVLNLVVVGSALTFLAFGATALAAKPAGNHAGAQTYGWHLSSAVMPVPPYGLQDIPGSDSASKLIVNEPQGAVLATLTGVMGGLAPNTQYTVYLSKPYTPYVDTGWDVSGNWQVAFDYLGTPYTHDMTLAQVMSTGAVSGSGGYPAGGPYAYAWSITAGSVSGNAIDLTADYTLGAVGTTMHMHGTIAADGSMSGTWDDNYLGGTRTGTWSTASGSAAKTHTGDAGWPGLLTVAVQPFTFTTDASGSGSWHLNLRSADVSLPAGFSVWVNNAGGTLLISDSATLQ